jgi:RHS repeat-associated protein
MNNHNVKIMDSGNRVVKVMRIFFRSSFSALLAFAILGSAQAQTGATVTFYHNDGLGSPVAATNADGDVIWRKTYDPYGREHNSGGSAAASNNIGYTGHRFDNDLDLVYAGARYYDPVIGRFMSVDPVGFQEGAVHSFNKYAYANNNPYSYVDPDGKLAFAVVALVALGTFVTLNSAHEAYKAETSVMDEGLSTEGLKAAGQSLLIDGTINLVLTATGLTALSFLNKMPATPPTKRVGRWMNPLELFKMRKSGKVQEGGGGQTRVSDPANPDTYRNPPEGDVYVEFDVPADSVLPHSRGTGRIPGPNSPDARAGNPADYEMPPATNIEEF